MTKIQSGELDSCGLLYQRYKKMLFAYFFNNMRNAAMSEDLVQVTFEKLIKYRKNYKATGTVKSWIFSIARNAFYDAYNSKQRHQNEALGNHAYGLVSDANNVEKTMENDERSTMVHKAMSMLTKEKREILSLIKFEEMKYREVAHLMNMSESAVKVRVFRIMKEMKGHLVKMGIQNEMN